MSEESKKMTDEQVAKAAERLARGFVKAMLPEEISEMADWIGGFKAIQRRVVQSATEHGWRSDIGTDEQRTDGDSTALLHSEISEGFEGMRAKVKPLLFRDTEDGERVPIRETDANGVPIGEGWMPVRGYNASEKIGPTFNCVEEEWADLIIRLMDEADRRGLKLAEAVLAKMAFNDKRAYRHGGKKI